MNTPLHFNNSESLAGVLPSPMARLGWPPKTRGLRTGLPRRLPCGGAAECELLLIPPGYIRLCDAIAELAEQREPGCAAVAFSQLPPDFLKDCPNTDSIPFYPYYVPWRDGPDTPEWDDAWRAIRNAADEIRMALIEPLLGSHVFVATGDILPIPGNKWRSDFGDAAIVGTTDTGELILLDRQDFLALSAGQLAPPDGLYRALRLPMTAGEAATNAVLTSFIKLFPAAPNSALDRSASLAPRELVRRPPPPDAAAVSDPGEVDDASQNHAGSDQGATPISAPLLKRGISIAQFARYYAARVANWPPGSPPPSEKADLQAAKERFPGLVRKQFRATKERFAPPEWRKPGPRKPAEPKLPE
jgi:hypothetical protein